jgi:hypothetical protein
MARPCRARRPRERESEKVEVQRPSRWDWANAILDGNVTVGLSGIRNEDRGWHSRLAAVSDAKSLGAALTQSTEYMEAYSEREIDHYATCSDFDEQFEEWCEDQADKKGMDDDQLKELKASTPRTDFAYDYWEPLWAWEQIKEDCKEPWFIYALLKEHPVETIRSNHDWFDLNDIIGFCPECEQALVAQDEKHATPIVGHRYKRSCALCVDDITCCYDRKGNRRPYLKCPSCAHTIFHKDDLDGPPARPLPWPPGIPQRKNFAGGPDFAPPWEE